MEKMENNRFFSEVGGFTKDASITFFRHGEADYSLEEKQDCDFEGSLTEEGRKQVERSAKELAGQMKQANEAAIIWTSKRERAIETARIIVDTLEKEDIPVVNWRGAQTESLHETASLSAPDVTPEFWAMKPKDEFFVRTWKELYEQGALPGGVETPVESDKKINRVLEYNRRVINKYKEKKQQESALPSLRIINVGHFESTTNILNTAFGGSHGIDKELGPDNAGRVDIDVETREDRGILRLQGPDDEAVYLRLGKDRTISRIDNT